MSIVRPSLASVLLLQLLSLSPSQLLAAAPFKIEAVDKSNGWPVPLVQLTTTHNLTFVTDNAGLVAVDAPELFGRETWFTVSSDGYQLPADGFGNRGKRLTPTPGGSAKIELTRTVVAKRLGRLTGAGLFAEAQKLGLHAEWQDSGIFGCDSIQIADHQGKRFWLWGDSNLSRYPLGIFHMSAATTPQQTLTSLQPPVAPAFTYFRNDAGQPRGVARMPGDGPTWLNGFISLPDRDGTPHLVSTYSKIRNFLEVYELGLCRWDTGSQKFERFKVLWQKSSGTPKPHVPEGHPVLHTGENGNTHALFGDPFPALKIPATFEAWQDPGQWQKLTPQPTLRAANDASEVKPHRGSVAYNTHRKKWVTVFTQIGGKPSHLGELWYAEAPAPTGPWGPAVKILSHQNYTFYNPRLHPAPDGRTLLFEGTYTNTFSNNPTKTPRHDYNQILYRLDLDDPALHPASR